MRIIEVEFEDINLDVDGVYTITFNEKVSTTVKVTGGKCENKPEPLSVPYRSHKTTAVEVCKVAVRFQDAEVVQQFELHYGKGHQNTEVNFKQSEGSLFNAEFKLRHIFYKQHLIDLLKSNEGITCLNVNINLLDAPIATKYDLKIKVHNQSGELVGAARVTDTSTSAYLHIDEHQEDNYEILISEDDKNFYRIPIFSKNPQLGTFPSIKGQVFAVTAQFIVGHNLVTSVFHSTSMKSNKNQGGSAAEEDATESSSSAIAATTTISSSNNGGQTAHQPKMFLFLEDASTEDNVSDEDVLKGVMEMHSHNKQSAKKHHLTNEQIHAGPKTGAYVVCSEHERGVGKTKNLHTTNLGILTVSPTFSTGKMKLRARLVRIDIERQGGVPASAASAGGSGNGDDDEPEKTGFGGESVPQYYTQTAVIVCKGMGLEVSREIHLDTGYITCNVEGKLPEYKTLNTTSADAAAAEDPKKSPKGYYTKFRASVSLVPSEIVLKEIERKEAEAKAAAAAAATPPADNEIAEIEKELQERAADVDLQAVAKTNKELEDNVAPAASDEMQNSTVLDVAAGKLADHDDFIITDAEACSGDIVPSGFKGAEGFGKLVDNEKRHALALAEIKYLRHAVGVCGQDIYKLQEEAAALNYRADEAEKALAANKVQSEEASKTSEALLEMRNIDAGLADKSSVELTQIIAEVLKALGAKEKEVVELQKALKSTKKTLDEYGDLKGRHKALQSAHMSQSKQMQSIQSDVDKIETFKATIESQEKVISKMQNLIEQKIKASNKSSPFAALSMNAPTNIPRQHKKAAYSAPSVEDVQQPPPAPVTDYSEDLEREIQARQAIEGDLLIANEKIESLEEQLHQLEMDLEEAKKKENHDSDSDSDSDDDKPDEAEVIKQAKRKIDLLEAENVSKAFRVKALEEQLNASAQEYTKEIAILRTKIFEMEMNGGAAADTDFSGMNLEDMLAEDDYSNGSSSSSSNNTKPPVGSRPASGSAVKAVNSLKAAAAKSPTGEEKINKEQENEKDEEGKKEKHEEEKMETAADPSTTTNGTNGGDDSGASPTSLPPAGGELTKEESVVNIDELKTPPVSSK